MTWNDHSLYALTNTRDDKRQYFSPGVDDLNRWTASSLRQQRIRNFSEFQTAKDTSWLQDSISFLQHSVHVCAITDAECYGVQILTVIRYRR